MTITIMTITIMTMTIIMTITRTLKVRYHLMKK